MKNSEKVRENNARRKAERRGYRLEKNRRRDPLAIGYGTWQLVDADTGALVAAKRGGYGLTLDEIEGELERGRA